MNSNKIFVVAIILSILIHAGIIAIIKFNNEDNQEEAKKGDPVEIEIIPKEKQEEVPPPEPNNDYDIESDDNSESTLEHDFHKGESKGQEDGKENIIVGDTPEQKEETRKQDKPLLEKNEESKKNLHDNIIVPKSDNFETMDDYSNEDSSKDKELEESKDFEEEYVDKDINLSDYKNILNKYAQSAIKETPKGKDTATFSAFEAKYESYFAKLRRKIYQIWQYPSDSIRRGEQGVMKVSFSILKDGSIVNIRVLESTGYSSLDREVMRILKSLGKTPLPKSYELEELNISEAYFIYTNSSRFLE